MLLDTSGLFAYLNARDPNHAAARQLLEAASFRLTHNYVLVELIALATARRFDRGVVLHFVEVIVRDPEFNVIWVTPEEHRDGLTLLQSRSDKLYSLCDAISFNLMRRHGLTEALSTDRHFQQEGLVCLLQQI